MELIIALILALIGTFAVLIPLNIVLKVVSVFFRAIIIVAVFVGMFVFFWAFDGWEIIKNIVF